MQYTASKFIFLKVKFIKRNLVVQENYTDNLKYTTNDNNEKLQTAINQQPHMSNKGKSKQRVKCF